MSSQLLFHIVFSVVVHLGLGSVNFALHKPAVQSTTLYYNNFNWVADKAVDGNISGSDPDHFRTCSSTSQTTVNVNHNWEVDIGFQIIVKTITVYGRTDGKDHLSGIKLYIGNESRPWIYNKELPLNSSNSQIYVFKPNNAIASVLSLMRWEVILVICEVTIEGDCERGNYGYNCNETCGNCLYGNNSCSITDGKCSDGCIAGWQGHQCDIGCDTGQYGYNCNETCGNCLYGNTSCDKSYGHCNNGCMAGWQGDDCKTACEAGTYGFNCNETCGYCLNENKSCLRMNGQCYEGCQAGWKGETCKSGCERGHYSYNCNGTCGNCLYGNTSCDTTDGNCTNGCIAGWEGYLCNTGTLGTVTTADVGPNAGVIVGSVLAAVGVSIFAMVIISVIVKNRRKKDNNEMITDNVTTAAHYANLVVGNPDAACNSTVRSREERETAFSASEEASLQRGIPIAVTNRRCGVMEPNVPAHNEYEKLRYVMESTESAYTTIDHNLIKTPR